MHPQHSTENLSIASQIVALITDRVGQADTVTRYRRSLVAFARTDDPRFDALQRRIPGHLHPRDLLPDARSVCAFFLPFASRVVESNQPSTGKCGPRVPSVRGQPSAVSRRNGFDDACTDSPFASRAWAQAYVETNVLLANLCATLVAHLERRGVCAAWEPPTHHFDPVRLVSAWSHKSVGAIAGLGQFGHHHMLITQAGCAGRMASIVLDAALPPTAASTEPYCTYDQGCRACVRRCPVGALTEDGLDRARCYARCKENDARFPEWHADVCGKCATGPCALRPVARPDNCLSEECSSGL